MNKIKPDELVGGLLFVAVGIFFSIFALRLGLVSKLFFDVQPGAGLYPLILGAGLAMLGAIMAVRSILPNKKHDAHTFKPIEEVKEGEANPCAENAEGLSQEEKKINIRIAVYTVLIIVVAMIMWNYVGFYPAVTLMCLALNFVFKTKPLQNVLLTVGTVGFVYLAFTYALKITFGI